jgi:hypothetical protein
MYSHLVTIIPNFAGSLAPLLVCIIFHYHGNSPLDKGWGKEGQSLDCHQPLASFLLIIKLQARVPPGLGSS